MLVQHTSMKMKNSATVTWHKVKVGRDPSLTNLSLVNISWITAMRIIRHKSLLNCILGLFSLSQSDIFWVGFLSVVVTAKKNKMSDPYQEFVFICCFYGHQTHLDQFLFGFDLRPGQTNWDYWFQMRCQPTVRSDGRGGGQPAPLELQRTGFESFCQICHIDFSLKELRPGLVPGNP